MYKRQILTFEEHVGPIKGRTLAWTGDANNVLSSFVHAAQRFDFTLNIATPAEYAPTDAIMAWAKANGARVNLTRDPYEAVKNADAVISDCWVSMGDADEEIRHKLLAPYQVNHCLLYTSRCV